MMNVLTLTASVLITNVKSFIAEVNSEKILVFILYFFQGMKYIGARKAFVKVGAITYCLCLVQGMLTEREGLVQQASSVRMLH